MSETVIVPGGSMERYPPSLSPECVPLQRASISLSGITDTVAGYFVERRAPSMHELIFSLGGAGRAWSDKMAPTALRPGDLLVAPCDTKYGYGCEEGTWRFMWFQLQNRGIWHGLRSLPVHIRRSGVARNLESVMSRLLTESMGQDLHWARVTTLFAELVVLYLERELALSDSPHERKMRQCLEELWGRVSGRLDVDWSVKALAAQANMSPSSFYRACERFMGQNPKQIMLRFRMQRAEELLLNQDYPLKMVAAMLGYGSAFSFSKAFKRSKKMSPKEYRRQAESGDWEKA